MATENRGDTVIKVYTANRPPEDDINYVRRADRKAAEPAAKAENAARSETEASGKVRRRLRKPDDSARRTGHIRRTAQKRTHTGRTGAAGRPYITRMGRDSLIVGALLLGVMSLKVLPFEWARRTTEVMTQAINVSVDLDKTLGQLQFVKEVIPESAMVFWNGGSSAEYASPFDGQITHIYSAQQPWLEYSGANQAVKSARAGKISQLEQGTAGDWAVRITHDDGMETVYAFLSDVSVKPGDSVVSSQEIGHASGVNGARIYFEMRINGDSVDPAPYLGVK